MNIHTETDWASGMAAMKNMALAQMMAREESHLESLRSDLRKECPEDVWRQIWSHITEKVDSLTIKMPTDHEWIKVGRCRNGDLYFEINSARVEGLGEAFVLADRRIQKLLRQQRREKWSRWQWFIWIISFTFAEKS